MNYRIRKRRMAKTLSQRELLRRKLIRRANSCPGVKEAMEIFAASKPLPMIVMVPNFTVISAASHANQ